MIKFKRKIYDDLLSWKNESNGKTAILLEGARRVGKTTIVKEFAENEYESYLYIDFATADENVKRYFEQYMNDLDTLLRRLIQYYGVELTNRKSAIIFDEVQFFPKARQAVKHLVFDGRYDYIETGSLISIKENVKDILIPSEEDRIEMYPMDFEEFLYAMKKENYISVIKTMFEQKQPVPNGIHEKIMDLFREYILIGGMPQALSEYLENNYSFKSADAAKRKILALYRSDIMKINTPNKGEVLSIFDQIPSLLSQHEKRVVFNKIGNNNQFEKYWDTFFWLSDSKISNECYRCNDPNVGLTLNENRTYVKCYLADTGLLVSHTFTEKELATNQAYRELLTGDLDLNKGMFFENVVAQILVSRGYKLYFYTHYSEETHKNDIEIDFIISNGSKLNLKIYPIEVKSGKRYTTKSLQKFNEKFKNRIGESYVIHTRNLSVKEDGTICIPVYMAICL